MKKIVILGSTGSIGKQTVEVILSQKNIQVIGLSANENVALMKEQIEILKPQKVAMMDKAAAAELRKQVGIPVLEGLEGLIELALMEETDMVVTAVVGMIGLRPTVAAIEAGKDIALANKETLVTAGHIIMPLVKKHQVKLIPVDSEHSAIFQCLQGNEKNRVESITITASGGPFLGKTREALMDISVEQALNHPNWSMGAKITVDSSTLVNKGLEVMEAKWLFDLEPDQIQVVVHPQSIIHSLVTYEDGSMMAQLGYPDMKLPIQYAIGYPKRLCNTHKRLKLSEIGKLTFLEPDVNTFKGLALAYRAMEVGKSLPVVYNAANEAAVERFLKGEIRYLDITDYIEKAMDEHIVIPCETIEDILQVEAWSHKNVRKR